jgi:hypothetical protein
MGRRNFNERVMKETVHTHIRIRSRLQDRQTDMTRYKPQSQTTSGMVHLNGTRKWTELLQWWKKEQGVQERREIKLCPKMHT